MSKRETPMIGKFWNSAGRYKDRRIPRWIETALLFCFLVMVWGCTPTASLTKAKPHKFNPEHYRTVVIKVSSSERDADTPNSINFFEDILFRRLKDKKIFNKVIKGSKSSNERPDLLIKAEILRTKHISRSMDFWFGALAGRAEIMVHIDMIDQTSEKNIAKTRVSGESSGSSTFIEATEEAFGQAADRVIEFIYEL